MGVGVARAAETGRSQVGHAIQHCRLGALQLAILGWFSLVAAAQNSKADEPPVNPPALSALCQAPTADISTPGALPRLTAALENKKIVRVLAIGSSSTVGVGATSRRHGYPAQLEQILEKVFAGVSIEIINRGVSGEVASTTADRLKLVVATEKPDLVLWQVGTNDALARVPVADFVDTLKNTLQWLKEHQIDTVLVGLQYTPRAVKDDHYTAIRTALREVAVSQNVLLVRRFEAMRFIEQASESSLLSTDDLHLDDLGYHCMAEHIARAVVVNSFLRRKPHP
jgi:acyl-CoA thioesterase-1